MIQTNFQQIVQNQREIDSLEVKHFHLKEDRDQALFQNALMHLGTVIDGKKRGNAKIAGTYTSTCSPLLQACYLVGEAMKMDINPEQFQKEKAAFVNDLSGIVQAFGMRYRQVALRGKWWKKDNGPLLGYMYEDDRPVALIPLSPGKYQLHDPTNSISLLVNQEVAQNVKPFAYTFYRPFPNKKLGFWDMLIDLSKSLRSGDIFMVILMGVAGGMLSIFLPLATGLVYDEIIPQGQRSQLIYIALFLVAGAISKLLFQFVQSFATLRLELKTDSSMQAALWDRLLSLPIDFFKKFSVGELAMKAINIGTIRQMLSGITISSIFSAVFSIPSVLLMFYYNGELASRALSLAMLVLGITVLFGKLKIDCNRRETETGNRLNGLVFQIIGGISKFRISGSERRAFFLWSREFSKLRRIEYRSRTLSNLFSIFYDAFPLVASIIVFYLISKAKNEVSIGIFIAFNAAFTSVLLSILSLTNALITVSNIIPIFESASPIFEALPEYNWTNRDPGDLNGDVELNHISFRYDSGAHLVLDDLSLHIHSGEYIAIVGASGSGKSTLLRILLGFEKPEVGKVYYDGQDLAELDIRKVRKQLGVVLQNSSLMPGDIYTNIVGSHSHLTMDDAWEAARMAGIEADILKMPMGMQTILPEEGTTLSGGQRQRLFIANAIANKPRILYFDEATSALDNKTQAVISQGLERLNVTRVVIAHRLSTIINCDRIIVLDKGKIVEEGSYKSLMDKNGVFAEMAKRQL